MDRTEFLEGLQRALETEIDGAAVRENVEYYSGYIADEIRRGRSEREVLDELGDPWIIARTIIGVRNPQNGQTDSEYVYDRPEKKSGRWEKPAGSTRIWSFDTWWKKLILTLCVVGVLVLVITVIGGILSLLAPILIPVFVVVMIIRLARRR